MALEIASMHADFSPSRHQLHLNCCSHVVRQNVRMVPVNMLMNTVVREHVIWCVKVTESSSMYRRGRSGISIPDKVNTGGRQAIDGDATYQSLIGHLEQGRQVRSESAMSGWSKCQN